MRNRMLDEYEFAAGVFIGGMEGVEEEYRMFIKKHPHAITLPIASTGAAAKKIYDEQFLDKNERLVKDYARNIYLIKYNQDGQKSFRVIQIRRYPS